jgi:hypothetical protein
MNPTNAECPEPIFSQCTAEHVFAEITSQVATSDVRGLWTRIQEEIKRQGVGASATYLGGEFVRFKEEFARELTNATTG